MEQSQCAVARLCGVLRREGESSGLSERERPEGRHKNTH